MWIISQEGRMEGKGGGGGREGERVHFCCTSLTTNRHLARPQSRASFIIRQIFIEYPLCANCLCWKYSCTPWHTSSCQSVLRTWKCALTLGDLASLESLCCFELICLHSEIMLRQLMSNYDNDVKKKNLYKERTIPRTNSDYFMVLRLELLCLFPNY